VCAAVFYLVIVAASAHAQFTAPLPTSAKISEVDAANNHPQIDTSITDLMIPSGLQIDTTNPKLPSAIGSKKDTSTKKTLDWNRVGIAAGGLAVAITGLHIYQLNAWWANQRTGFHVIEDADYQAEFDKFGHTFGAYYSAHFFDEAYTWAGLDSAQSTLLAAFSGALWEFYVEIEDGFARDWGFSRGDAKSDITGATFFLLRNRIPFLRNFEYKWSYFPSEKYLQNKPDIPGQTLNFIEDYGGQSYWMSMNIHGMLPDGLKEYWPSWLNVAVGCSGAFLDPLDLNSPNIFDLRHKSWLISLDYDFSKIFPATDCGIWEFIKRGLDYWHFPAPAYRFYPDHRFFVLFPFQMTIGK
jgi:hypothetical protein